MIVGGSLIGVLIAAGLLLGNSFGGIAYLNSISGSGGLSPVQSNPLYQGAGYSGNNPLYKSK